MRTPFKEGGRTEDELALEVSGLGALYGLHQVLHGIDLFVRVGEVVALLGANGAGKSTLLRCLAGVMSSSGVIRVFGRDRSRAPASRLVKDGVALVPEGRGTFPTLTVRDNLRLGEYASTLSQGGLKERRERLLSLFPVLAARMGQQAGTLSGGEQQMLAIARALMSGPRLLLLDEPSLGLAPSVTSEVFAQLTHLRREMNLSILLVEQNAELGLRFASRVYVLQAGVQVMTGTSEEIQADAALRSAYLGE